MRQEKFRRHGDVYIFDSEGKRVDSMDPAAFERYELNGTTYLVVSEAGVSITHEEHGVGYISPGVKEVRIDREYDYLSEMSRRTAD